MGGIDWIDLAQDRDKWWALVNTVMNLRFHKWCGISWVAYNMLASQEGLCFVELVIPDKFNSHKSEVVEIMQKIGSLNCKIAGL